jgi:hypothetical protein
MTWLGLPERYGIYRISEGKNVLWMYGPAKVAQDDKMVEIPSKSKAVPAMMDDQRLKESCHGVNFRKLHEEGRNVHFRRRERLKGPERTRSQNIILDKILE